MTITIVDTNILVGALIDTDDNHDVCARIIEDLGEPIVIPALAVAEICHFLESKIGAQAEVDFAKMIVDGLIIPYYNDSDWELIHKVTAQYVDHKMGVVDASVCVTAESNKTNKIASMDNHFRSVVTDKTPFFEVDSGF